MKSKRSINLLYDKGTDKEWVKHNKIQLWFSYSILQWPSSISTLKLPSSKWSLIMPRRYSNCSNPPLSSSHCKITINKDYVKLRGRTSQIVIFPFYILHAKRNEKRFVSMNYVHKLLICMEEGKYNIRPTSNNWSCFE